MANIPEEALLALAVKNKGGGGGTSNYEDLENKPQIAGTTLSGNKSLADLGIASAQSVSNITNGESINNFAEVEDALSNKQNKLTAGNYIAIENDGTIKVTQGIGVYDVYSYKIEGRVSGTNYWTNVIKYKNGIQQSSNTYYNMEATTPINIDDRLTLQYVRDGVSWHVTLLVDSNEHQAGEDITWKYNVTKDLTETFNVSQDSSTDLATKGDITTALSPILDGQSIDSFADVETALALKQNATDNSLDTDAKTIVGAINEHEGDISSLKSGFTNLDNEVNGDATEYPYADVITIEDSVPANLADCSVKIEPVQDLHGQSAPYVGGAGKNKLPLTVDAIKALNTNGTWSGNVYTVTEGTVEILADNANNVVGIKVNITAGEDRFVFALAALTNYSGYSYILNGCPSGGGSNAFEIQWWINNVGTYQDFGDGVTVPLIAENKSNSVSIIVRSGYTVNNKTFYPMLRLSTETDSTFAPYTNICPISGHTEVDVQRDGRNLLGILGYWSVDESTNIATLDTTTQGLSSGMIPVTVGQTFTASKKSALNTSSGHTRVLRFDANRNYISRDYVQRNNVTGCATYTVEQGVSYVAFTVYMNNTDWADKYGFELQVEYGNLSTTTYEPYAGKTYTIALGSTIYGGTVDFDSGVLSSYGDIKNENNFAWGGSGTSAGGLHYVDCSVSAVSNVGISNMLPKEDSAWDKTYPCVNIYASRIRVYGNFTSLDEFKEQFSGLQIYYQKATPTTIQLTPQQIQLLKGQNTLTASTGQISVTVNGVSGAIGQVQEQVNELAEDVAEVQSGLTTLGTRVNGIYTRTFYNDTTSTTLKNVYLPKTDKHTVAIIAGNDICTMVVSPSAIVEQNNIRNQITVALNESNQFVVSGCPYYSRPMFIATYDFRQQPS